MIRRFTSSPNLLFWSFFVHVVKTFIFCCTETVLHSIETFQVGTCFCTGDNIISRIQKYTLILTHIKKKHTNVQKKYKKASRMVLIPVLLQAYRSQSKIISVLTERKLTCDQRFLRILCLSIMQKSLIVWKKPDWSLSEKQTWMNLPWEVQQRPRLRHHQKPMESGTCTGRFFRWFLCSSSSRRNLSGTWFRYRRIYPSAKFLLWCNRN